ncbi:hypothetical protein SteCoe_29345 [Stentor coeruleus]|uniref:Replication protein A subunit n=1 Tax=Stentor coeruleus TaxID=5963 RepID=A0A1R2B6G9_9CILI|nr:hypothetical protein SteCoe_29345 [Stentor coeruleus]
MLLTQNAVSRLLNGAKKSDFTPTVQIIETSVLKNGIKIIISDGDNCTQAISLCPEITKSNYQAFKNRIISLSNYQTGIVSGFICIRVLEIELQLECEDIIGDPRALEKKVESETPKNILYKFSEPKIKTECAEEDKDRETDRETDSFYAPICALSITSSDWTIKARVTKKNKIVVWSKTQSEGKLFSCVLMDSKSDEIQATFFNAAVDLFESRIKEGRVYTFSGGNIKYSNKSYAIVSNDIEINFDKNSLINEVADDGSIPKIRFNFIPLDRLPKVSIDQSVDVCGIIMEIEKPITVMTKKGTQTIKRTMLITDYTDFSIEVTLWASLAQLPEFDKFEIGEKPIVCFKNLKLKDFNKLSLASDFQSTHVIFNVEGIKEAENLQTWKLRQARIYPSTPLSERKTLQIKYKTTAEIKEEWGNFLNQDKSDIFRLIGIIGKITLNDSRNIWYEACANGTCKKKVNKNSDGLFMCDSCNTTSDKCEYRYLYSLTISDCSGYIYATAFDEIMTELIGIKASEMQDLVMNQPLNAEDKLAAVFGKFVNVVIKAAESDNKTRYKFTIKNIDPFDASAISKMLLNECIIKN